MSHETGFSRFFPLSVDELVDKAVLKNAHKLKGILTFY